MAGSTSLMRAYASSAVVTAVRVRSAIVAFTASMVCGFSFVTFVSVMLFPYLNASLSPAAAYSLALKNLRDFEKHTVGFGRTSKNHLAIEGRTKLVGAQSFDGRQGRKGQNFTHLGHRLNAGCIQFIELCDVSQNGVQVALHLRLLIAA